MLISNTRHNTDIDSNYSVITHEVINAESAVRALEISRSLSARCCSSWPHLFNYDIYLSMLRATTQLKLRPLAGVLKTALHAQSSTILQVLIARSLPGVNGCDVVSPKTAACMPSMGLLE